MPRGSHDAMKYMGHLVLAWTICMIVQFGPSSASFAAGEPTTPATPPEVSAEPSARSRARELFAEASRQATRRNWMQAAQLYKQSYDVEPHASTLLNIGLCHERLQRPTYALSYVIQALNAPASHQLREDHALDARTHVRALQAQLGTVHLLTDVTKLPGKARLAVEGYLLHAFQDRDSKRIIVVPSDRGERELPWDGDVSLQLEPGRYTIAMSYDNVLYPRHVEVQVGHTSTIIWTPVVVPPSVKKPLSATPRGPLSVEHSVRDNNTLFERPWTAVRVGAASSLALSAIGLGVSIGYGLPARRLERKLTEVCSQGNCSVEHRDDIARYREAARWSNIGAVAALGGIGLSALLFVLDSELAASTVSAHATNPKAVLSF